MQSNNEKSEIKLNEKGQCPFCKKKPLIYKRDRKYFCAKCARDFDLQTGGLIENWHWTKDNQCKHSGRPKNSKCPSCGKWDNEKYIERLYPGQPQNEAKEKPVILDESKIDRTAEAMNFLAKLHGIPVMRSPYVKEPTLIIPEGYKLPNPSSHDNP